LDPAQDHALLFQRLTARNVKLDRQQTDNHRTTKTTKTTKTTRQTSHAKRLCVLGELCGSPLRRHGGYAFHREHFNPVAHLDVVEPFEADAALEPGLHLADIVLEPAQPADLPFVDDDVVAEQPRLGFARARAPAF